MATNLYLADAGVMLNGATAALSHTESSTYPLSNLFGGNKTDYFELEEADDGDVRITIDAGAAVSADYLYLGGCATLQKNYIDTITLKGHSSDNYGAATTVATLSSFTSATLRGPHSDDYIATFSSASFRYWYINYNATSASKVAHAKAFLGAKFDPGRDPNQPLVASRVRTIGGRRKSLYTFELAWQGLDYAKAVTLYTRFYKRRRFSPVVLFTTDYHAPLQGCRVMFGRITEMTLPPRVTGLCNVSLMFEELL